MSVPKIIEFGVNTESSISSLIYVNGQLFKITSTSNNTSSNCDHVNNDLPVDLNRLCFVIHIKRSYCLQHNSALEKMNFQIILSLLKKSWIFSPLFNHFAPALMFFVLSEYIMFGFPLLKFDFIKHLLNSVAVRIDTSSRCATLLQENNKCIFIL